MRISSWQLGVEQEVTPSNYATLLTVVAGWPIWQFETRNGKYFSSAKGVEGTGLAVPLELGQALFAGVPSIHVNLGSSVKAIAHGSHFENISTDLRVVGDRFGVRISGWFDPIVYEGQKLQLTIRSMPGPRSFSRIKLDEGVVDMTGIEAVISAARKIETE